MLVGMTCLTSYFALMLKALVQFVQKICWGQRHACVKHTTHDHHLPPPHPVGPPPAAPPAALAAFREQERLVGGQLRGLAIDASWLKSYAVGSLVATKEALQVCLRVGACGAHGRKLGLRRSVGARMHACVRASMARV
jgi:hypothetical protein